MMDPRVKILRAKAKHLVPVTNIGKNGLTPGVVTQIDKELKDKHLIKVKFLKGALGEEAKKKDRKDLAQKIAQATNALIVEQVGSVVVLWREN